MVINYTYDANGTKLNYRTINNTESYDYIGSFYYENGTLSHILTSEGRVVHDADGDFSHHEYHMKDHLGNTRVVFTEDDGVIKNNDYYPFGMIIDFANEEPEIGSNDNKFLYNGKEFIKEIDLRLGWYDYGARFYDPALGRWHSVDPMAEVSRRWSPYAYCYNNPLRFIDPDGMVVDDYGVDDDGNVSLLKETDDDYDVLYAVDDNGEKQDTNNDNQVNESDGQKVEDQSLLPQLADETNVGEATSLGVKVTGLVANTENRTDAYNVFKFAAENSNVEWSYQRYTDGTAAVSTAHENAVTITGTHHVSNKGKTVAADVHSHPGATRDDLRGSGTDYYRARMFVHKNGNAKVQLYMPRAPRKDMRMLDLINNKWITNY